MEQERINKDRNSTLIDLTSLKSELLEIKQLSLSIPAEVNNRSGGVFVSLRVRIDDIIKDIQGYINEVRIWK